LSRKVTQPKRAAIGQIGPVAIPSRSARLFHWPTGFLPPQAPGDSATGPVLKYRNLGSAAVCTLKNGAPRRTKQKAPHDGGALMKKADLALLR
jgi:hypothetical protein